jgi:hypothetical protein
VSQQLEVESQDQGLSVADLLLIRGSLETRRALAVNSLSDCLGNSKERRHLETLVDDIDVLKDRISRRISHLRAQVRA